MIAIVSGALANKAWNGGNAWARLSWTQGLERLGVETYFVEQLRDGAPADGAAFFDEVTSRFALSDRAALIGPRRETLHGLDAATLADVAASTDLLVNMGGHLTFEPINTRVRMRLYLDDDPGFTQFWQAAGDAAARLDGHDVYYTFGTRIGSPSCRIPTAGIEWRPTRPPVVLAEWPFLQVPEVERFTTVATWRGPYGPIEHEGVRFGDKVHEFRKVIELPERVGPRFELALDIDPAETASLEQLERHGWQLVDAKAVAGEPGAFRRYVQRSWAEFSVAKGIYVETGSGWFSDRTTRYLASGRPAVVQDTGFGETLAVGQGLLTFSTLEEAVAGVERIAADYDAHARAARELAERHFDSDVVLGRLLDEIGLAP